MKNIMLHAGLFLALSAFIYPPQKKLKIFLAGDSTMSVKEPRAYPETGWGMPFIYFFDSTVVVDNRAKNGRSTKTFISEGLWDKLISDVSAGDYVFIQFGHNDESKDKGERYAEPAAYKANLVRFVNETRGKKGNPVLLTPVSRRRFKEGKQQPTHEEYSNLVREVASQLNVPLIDLDQQSMELYQQAGEEASKWFFLQLQPGQHPNYPEGKTDNTHFSELGARLIAQIVLSEIKRLDPELAARIVKPAPKK